jgi:hypothetical protein
MSRPNLPELTTGRATWAAGGGREEEDAVKDGGPKPVVPLLLVSAGGGVHEIQTFAHYVGTRVTFVIVDEQRVASCLLLIFFPCQLIESEVD